MNNKTPDDIVKGIVSGKYRDYYLIYNRKSTDDADNQKNSIKYQKSENARFAFRGNLQIASLSLEAFATDGIVSERHSGFKEDARLLFGKGNTVQYRVERPKFHRLVQFLNGGYFKGVIFLCWDRASRNKGDDTILRKLMKGGVDIRFALAHYEKTSAGELHMDIDGMFSEHHSRVTREKVTITMRNALARGLWPHKAGVGYLNEGNMEHKPKDPRRAPIILRLAELAETGEWSLADLAHWAIEQGFTMPPVRRRRTTAEILAEEEDDLRVDVQPVARLPSVANIYRILTNRFYTGKMLGNDGVWIPSSSHEAIIPEGLFDRVQAQLRKRNRSVHYADLLDHPMRGIARCGICQRVYTPYQKKGTVYYRVRCSEGCANSTKNFNFDFIAKRAGELIERLSFTDEEREEIDTRASTDIAILETKRLNHLDENDRRKKKLREDLAYLNANKLMLLRTGAYTAERLVAEETELNSGLAALCDTETASDVSIRETVRDVVKLSELLKNAAVVYYSATAEEKDTIIRIIFSELTLTDKTLEYKCKKGFASLASRFIAVGDPTEWLSELGTHRSDIKGCMIELGRVLCPEALAA